MLYEDSEALKYCGYQGMSCSGVTSMGSAVYYEKDSGKDTRFTLLAYDSVDNAKVGMKTFVAHRHEAAGDKLKPLSVQAGADETDAYAKENASSAILRVGTVVAYVAAPELKPKDLQTLAKLQVDRIKVAATGKSPDA
ncbi:hypothetical protein [Streptomyces sp. NPDC048650]|uniref:hypothetical protein n=1 Tax=unclassified Streptomyces TaxID=2593676 RepID=UPI0037158BB7